MTEFLTPEEAARIPLPLNPFKRNTQVGEMLAQMSIATGVNLRLERGGGLNGSSLLLGRSHLIMAAEAISLVRAGADNATVARGRGPIPKHLRGEL